MSSETLTLLMFGGLFGCLFIGIPITFSMTGIAAITILSLWGVNGLYIIIMNIFGVMWNIIFINIPLYIFMGILLERSGLAEALFDCIYRWTCRISGGLAMGTVVICAIFGAMTGVAGSETVAMGLVALPAMLSRGYNKKLALGTISAGGTLGLLIPPSILMILLSTMVEISVGKLFMGGVIPGLLLSVLFIIYIGVRSLIQPDLCPRQTEKFSFWEKVISIKAVFLPMFIIFSVLGTIFFGIASPTEAGAIGSVACLITVAIYRRLSWQLIKESTIRTFSVSGMVMWVAFGAVAFSNVYISLEGGKVFSDFILGLQVDVYLIFAIIILIILLLGCFIDPTGIVFIVAPVAFPIIKSFGFDLIWFGIIFVISLQCGFLTPPFGFSLFYMKSIAPPGVTMGDIYKSIWPFVCIMLVLIAILTIFPGLVLWLPEVMMEYRK